jgi:hypothetical protein
MTFDSGLTVTSTLNAFFNYKNCCMKKIALLFNFHLPGQNGIRVKFYHFWPKNGDEKWSRINIFEIP